jgi:hypothetical protein
MVGSCKLGNKHLRPKNDEYLTSYATISFSIRTLFRGLGYFVVIPYLKALINLELAVPWLKRLVHGLSSCRPGFVPWSVHVGFVVDKVALG